MLALGARRAAGPRTAGEGSWLGWRAGAGNEGCRTVAMGCGTNVDQRQAGWEATAGLAGCRPRWAGAQSCSVSRAHPSAAFPPFLGTGTTRNKSSHGLTFVCLMAPLLTTWQDHMRRAGDVCHAQTNRDGTGEVEFSTYEDMKYAVC